MVNDEIIIINTLNELRNGIKETRRILRGLRKLCKENKTDLRNIFNIKKDELKEYKKKLKELLDREVYWVKRNNPHLSGKILIKTFSKVIDKSHYLLFYNEYTFRDHVLEYIDKSIDFLFNNELPFLIKLISSNDNYEFKKKKMVDLFNESIYKLKGGE